MSSRSLTILLLPFAAATVAATAAAQTPARPVDRPTGHPVPLARRTDVAAPAAAVSAADAAMRGDVATVRQLVARGGDVNAAQGDGMTALHWAAERGDSAMVSALLRARADVGARTRIGSYTPLHLAARTGNPATVRALLAASSDVRATTSGGATALHLAAAAGNADAVRALLAKGADANARESVWGQTPLVFAAEADRADAVAALLAGGADPSIRTRVVNLTEQAARQQAAEKKRNAVLISFEPPARHDSAEADFKRASTAARAAAQAAAPRSGDPAALVTNAPQGGGLAFRLPVREPRGPFTPEQIQAAIDSGRAVLQSPVVPTDSVREQVDTLNGGVQGYVKQVGSVGGLTALHHAARQGSVAAALALVAGGAKLDDTSYVDRMTPLLVATVNGQFDVALRLVERGADPNAASSYGMTPLYATINAQWAPKSRYPQPQAIQTQKTSYLEVVDSLLAKGANPNARLAKQPWWFAYNNCGSANCGLEVIDGTTPFWRAAYALDVDAMRLLKRHGANDTTPSTPPRPAARAAATAAAARPDSAAKRGADTATVATRRVGPPPTPADPPAHPS
ncbi:MAG: ankyrin repeat domain-containing protein, partial [Gemmatirosa sp.]|nr:ankyrin repeat domain-containing protein [Gemmatirosa sp.]